LCQIPKIYKKLIKRNELTLVQKMLKLNDGSCIKANVMAMTRSAAKTGNIYVLNWIVENYGRYSDITSYAAKGGQMETLKWLIERGFTIDEYMTASFAAGNGNMTPLHNLYSSIHDNDFIIKSLS
jgi:hypothetical protein